MKNKVIVENAVLECLQEIDEFEEDDDLISIAEYGGGSDESFIQGNKNALRLFALDILRKTCAIETETGILGCFDPQSTVSLDYVSVVDHSVNTSKRSRVTFRDRIIGIIIFAVLFLFLLSAFVGFMTMIRSIFGY